ncbi:hypothetical protein FGSG_08251 [Fusarium graminearum PH-1]|uniref:Chromosome 2, complete genome n=1 Tax=Gibberella zeae (strain ATCC MYA-4620 / CBS 123657 / FGSC 9075 / NRRL 31084 / PH-1) TaxID=229533 RepID=I1RVH5_GIBZE|nr:hypothetical protein FGSG_08251 [Fusarium graminearum PH-1]ESU15126.1 hypothetical protein FGSG_08251 [Fusarium graminearum PH-1]CEF76541.1 unnamed protein product [Fusarium graminearum]|eukprot:XP_011320551.1 hypothetical protein FGSG_08251 [Fusarium graminearum PH-1]
MAHKDVPSVKPTQDSQHLETTDLPDDEKTMGQTKLKAVGRLRKSGWLFASSIGLGYHIQRLLLDRDRGLTSADADGNRNIYEFDVINKRSTLPPARLFTYEDAGFPDGVKVDADGRVYGGVAGAVDVWSDDGVLLCKIKVKEGDTAVNMQFVENKLYIHGRNSIYAV